MKKKKNICLSADIITKAGIAVRPGRQCSGIPCSLWKGIFIIYVAAAVCTVLRVGLENKADKGKRVDSHS